MPSAKELLAQKLAQRKGINVNVVEPKVSLAQAADEEVVESVKPLEIQLDKETEQPIAETPEDPVIANYKETCYRVLQQFGVAEDKVEDEVNFIYSMVPATEKNVDSDKYHLAWKYAALIHGGGA